ncbi:MULTISPECIES: anti-repressor SinI family protein [Bacillaceae]
MNVTVGDLETVDKEWLALILEAKEIGISIEEIREFLSQNGMA